MSTLDVELFTHPMCKGCQEALTALRALAGEGRLTLEVTSLGTPRGRRRAADVGVSVVPTVRIGTGYRLLENDNDLEALLAGDRAMIETCGSAGKGCTFPDHLAGSRSSRRCSAGWEGTPDAHRNS